jgi:hydrogenase/urease accessory protein HupE
MALILLLCPLTVSADALRPAYLEIRELTQDNFNLLWKLPAKGDRTLRLYPQLPANCQSQGAVESAWVIGTRVDRQALHCRGGLVGQTVDIDGLAQQQNDVLVRLNLLDSGEQTWRLNGDNNAFTVSAQPSIWQVVKTYLLLGIEHILAGLDHLLFVLALVMIVTGLKRLVLTITAFTLAHSITLAGATLDWFWLPSAPVEAVIALSILLLAVEIVHSQRGRVGATERWPWLVAFIFGLLHGFGFAGALQEVGLPSQAIPAALLFFNLGVEIGQLLFVLGILMLGRLNQRLALTKSATSILAYGIGSLAAFWTIERVAAFWT